MLKNAFRVGLLMIVAACAPGEKSDTTQLTPVAYEQLPGWAYDHHAEAFGVFAQSCRANATRAHAWTTKTGEAIGNGDRWRAACTAAQTFLILDDAQARGFFEQYFAPVKVTTEREPFGQLTGYYLPLLQGSLVSDARYRYPVYGVPPNMVKGDPQLERAAIEAGSLVGKAPILLYVDDPVMLFFVHIQGSGKVQLTDGRIVTLQYAAQNGHGYVAIGKPMKEQGLLTEVSLQTIRDYLYQHPVQAPGIMNLNPSYIFFALKTDESTAKGAMGLSLTPLRSVAIDDDRATYGVPTYISTTHWNYYTRLQEPLNRLLVAQDTGGALHGPHRGDIFFGIGPEAEWAAGQQNTRGEVFWLLPR